MPDLSPPFACPCCGYATLPERGGFDMCPICFWEDDGQDSADADVVRGGPNGPLSLTEGRRNFLAIGACHPVCVEKVRAPGPADRRVRLFHPHPDGRVEEITARA